MVLSIRVNFGWWVLEFGWWWFGGIGTFAAMCGGAVLWCLTVFVLVFAGGFGGWICLWFAISVGCYNTVLGVVGLVLSVPFRIGLVGRVQVLAVKGFGYWFVSSCGCCGSELFWGFWFSLCLSVIVFCEFRWFFWLVWWFGGCCGINLVVFGEFELFICRIGEVVLVWLGVVGVDGEVVLGVCLVCGISGGVGII